jgi:putative zinc finger protein
MTDDTCGTAGLLPAYAAGSPAGPDGDRVARHLATCARCRADLASWRAIAAATSATPAPPAPDPAALVRAVLARSALERGPAGPAPVPAGGRGWAPRQLRYLAALVLAEARLVRIAVPLASALVLGLGMAVVRFGTGTGTAAEMLALVAPIVAAAGVAGAYRAGHDPAAELVAATPASGRMLLLVRLTLVLGFDLVLALAASAVLAATAGGAGSGAGLDVLVAAWLGPMALLSALSLLVAVRFGPDVALGVAVGLWSLRVLAGNHLLGDSWLLRLALDAWTTNPAVLALSAVAGLAAVAMTTAAEPWGREPRGPRGATHPV